MGRETIRILGIDTSLRSSGVGIVEARGNELRAVAYGRIVNKPKVPHSRCLENIFNSITELIETHAPDCAGIEGAFFAKNAKTAMVLGQARGAATWRSLCRLVVRLAGPRGYISSALQSERGRCIAPQGAQAGCPRGTRGQRAQVTDAG